MNAKSAARERAGVQLDLGGPDKLRRDSSCKVGFIRGVDQYGIAALIVHRGANAIAAGLQIRQFVMRRLVRVADTAIQCANAELECGHPRDHIAGIPAWKAPTVITAVCRGSMLRATMLCSPITMVAPRDHRVGRAVRHGAMAA